jgi:hypothetical protein
MKKRSSNINYIVILSLLLIESRAKNADNSVLPMKSHTSDVTTSLDRKIHSRIFHERPAERERERALSLSQSITLRCW